MSNLKQACELSLEKWSKQIDKEMDEAEARGELPHKTPEQLKAEADAIWRKVHS